jgi:phosphoserine phosphatase RsbU/P
MQEMLPPVFERNFEQIALLAQAWIHSGAQAFGIFSGDQLLAGWPAGAKGYIGSIAAQIRAGDTLIGEVRAAGVNGSAAQARLQADADMIGRLAAYESDLGLMAGGLLESRDQLLALYNLTQTTRSCFEMPQLLKTVAAEAQRLAGVETALLAVRPAGEGLIFQQQPHAFISDDLLQRLLSYIQYDERPFMLLGESEAGETWNGASLLLTPFDVRGADQAVLGMVGRFEHETIMPYVKLSRSIAEYTGGQIENILLFKQGIELAELQAEMDLARNVQLSLLPAQLPSIDGLDIWADSRPASQVGGDFYDLIYKPGQPLTFTAGDVSGKGMPAALMMAMTRTIIRSRTNTSPLPSPAAILERSSAELFSDFSEAGLFCTVFIGQYQPEERILTYTDAGHSPIIYCPSGGPAVLLQADCVPMGILPGSACKDYSILLAPGDVLVAGSDGLAEARRCSGEQFGYDRLYRLVENLAACPAKEIAQGIFSEIDEFCCGEEQEDDQTLVVLKATKP